MIHDHEHPPTFWEHFNRPPSRRLNIFVWVSWALISGTALNWAFHHFV